jgi:hypothetical protein
LDKQNEVFGLRSYFMPPEDALVTPWKQSAKDAGHELQSPTNLLLERKIMKTYHDKIIGLIAVLCLGLGLFPNHHVEASLIISFNARGGAAAGGMVAGDTAGAPGVNAGNWNNMNSPDVGGATPRDIIGSIAAGNLSDNTGTLLGSTAVSWNGKGVSVAIGGGSNDAAMWSSEWDLFASNAPDPLDMTITVTGVPYNRYDVYFYTDDASNASIRGGDVIANGVLKSITMFNDSTAGYTEADSAFTWDATNTAVGSYLRIPGLTGSTLTLEMDARNASVSRLRMSGFQIVQIIPEPSSFTLVAIGLLGLACRLRRCC